MSLIYNKKVKKEYTLKERTMHMSWCIKNDIIITYEPLSNYNGEIMINYKGNCRFHPGVFKSRKADFKKNDKIWWKEIMELYTNEYLKENKNDKEA